MSRRLSLPEYEIASRYEAGESVNQLAKLYGTSRRTITSRLVGAGIVVRSNSAQLVIVNEQRSPEERKRLAQAAHHARRGKPRPVSEKVKSAQTRQRNGALTAYERTLFDFLVDRGYQPIPSIAVGPYCFDLGLPEIAVLVEADPDWHASARKRAQDTSKDAFAAVLGFHVVRVRCRAGRVWIGEEVIADLDVRRANPAALCEQRVLWCRLQEITARGEYDKLATVDTLREALHGA